eukprot:8085251-Ditylum_brightwellii.AAC.1
MGVILFGNTAFGTGILKSTKCAVLGNVTHCVIDGVGAQFCVRISTLGCLGIYVIWGGGVTILGGGTGGVTIGE